MFGILWVFGGVGLLLGDGLKMQLYHLIEVQTDRCKNGAVIALVLKSKQQYAMTILYVGCSAVGG